MFGLLSSLQIVDITCQSKWQRSKAETRVYHRIEGYAASRRESVSFFCIFKRFRFHFNTTADHYIKINKLWCWRAHKFLFSSYNKIIKTNLNFLSAMNANAYLCSFDRFGKLIETRVEKSLFDEFALWLIEQCEVA